MLESCIVDVTEKLEGFQRIKTAPVQALSKYPAPSFAFSMNFRDRAQSPFFYLKNPGTNTVAASKKYCEICTAQDFSIHLHFLDKTTPSFASFLFCSSSSPLCRQFLSECRFDKS
jgi:hypothetical protein